MSKEKNVEEPRFGEAMAELEAILGRIEGEEVDIDVLAEELRRAAVLLETCRTKIRKAEVEVSQIVQSLQSEDDSGSDGEEPELEPDLDPDDGDEGELPG